MVKFTLAAAIPALLETSAPTTSFDATTVITDMMSSAQSQLLAAVGIVSGAVVAVTLSVVVVKFGAKWIRRLGSAG